MLPCPTSQPSHAPPPLSLSASFHAYATNPPIASRFSDRLTAPNSPPLATHTYSVRTRERGLGRGEPRDWGADGGDGGCGGRGCN
uniref:Uncharacterized protein n=1 Tax=Oryza sativa subsp. japonica TaxID=39947 RepID=Q6YVY9_ORYSJ|nr:hypothetical protein [Oryza sativa Japonica Group]BAD31709.1 hypothetical protein [Oryza sativa Japonica Group]